MAIKFGNFHKKYMASDHSGHKALANGLYTLIIVAGWGRQEKRNQIY